MIPTSQTLATGPFKGALVAEQNDRLWLGVPGQAGGPGASPTSERLA